MATLQINNLEDGCVVYQQEQDRAHFLNRMAAAVLDLCDGHHGFVDIEAQVATRFAHYEPGRNLTRAILRRFIAEGLVLLEPKPAGFSAHTAAGPTNALTVPAGGCQAVCRRPKAVAPTEAKPGASCRVSLGAP